MQCIESNNTRLCHLVFFASIVFSIFLGIAHAQTYPDKPIRVLANPAGGAPDFVARLLAPGLSQRLGQQVIIDNRPAAVAIEAAAKAAPDGHTLVITGSALWLLPFLREQVPWQPTRDFAPITAAISSPLILVVHPALPVRSVRDLIALAKARPGELNYGSAATGTLPHIAAELFKAMAHVNIVRVAYKGAGAALVGIASGEVQTAFGTTSSVMPHIQAGRLRALAVTSAVPSPLAPGLPTVASIVPGYEAVSIVGVFAPARTPEGIVSRLNRDIVAVLNTPEVKEKALKIGAETVGDTPAHFAAMIQSEMARHGKVIKASGIHEQ